MDKEIDDISNELYKKIDFEIKKILKDQMKALWIDYNNAVIKRCLYPDDPKVLAVYKWNDITILVVRISDNNMGVEFDIPKLTIYQGENDNV